MIRIFNNLQEKIVAPKKLPTKKYNGKIKALKIMNSWSLILLVFKKVKKQIKIIAFQ
jgi:hypothetical protein